MRWTVLILTCLSAVLSSCARPEPAGAPLDVRADRRAWALGESGGVELRTTHYRIYTNTSGRMLLHCLPGFLEAARAHYLRLTGLTDAGDSRAMVVYLLASRDEWAALTRQVVGPQAPLYLSIDNGGYCYRGVCVFWDMGGLGTLMVAAHEGMHQFLHHRLADALPTWAEELLCVSAEGYEITQNRVRFTPDANALRVVDLRKALIAGRWIGARRLVGSNPAQALGQSQQIAIDYYAQLWALGAFVRSRADYRAGLGRLLADAAAGRLDAAMNLPPGALGQLRVNGPAYDRTVSEPLFRHYIAGDLEAFDREFRAFARGLAQLGA